MSIANGWHPHYRVCTAYLLIVELTCFIDHESRVLTLRNLILPFLHLTSLHQFAICESTVFLAERWWVELGGGARIL